jgi:orotidine-5'-phosphate decarboxylase
MAAIKHTGSPVCVGIDPVFEKLPASLRRWDARRRDRAEALLSFGRGVLEAVTEAVPVVKIQSACFERYGFEGVEAYQRLIHDARSMGLIVIADAKRGDVELSAEHYAAGCLLDYGPDLLGPDALTINAYFGDDGLAPFTQAAQQNNKGIFALVRTSNPGGSTVQGPALESGGSVAEGVGRMVQRLGEMAPLIGPESGLSLLGAVVGATHPKDAAKLRELMPEQIFLVPGFGAQGGRDEGILACFNELKQGAIITASRSVIYAFESTEAVAWQTPVRDEAQRLRDHVGALLGR